MTAKELLNRMRSAGFDVSISTDGCLLVEEKRWIDDELNNLISIHRVEMIELLKANNG